MSGPWEKYQTAAPAEEGPWTKYAAQPETPAKPSVMEDVAKTIPSGLARGAAGVVGLPGALQDLTDEVVAVPGRLYNKVFGSGRYEDTPSMQRGREAAPKVGVGDVLTADNAQRTIERVTGPLYKPQTTAGEYVNTLAEFAPGAAFGVGGPIARAAQVAVPALASETAGQLTKGTEAEPYARFAGAVAGGVGTAVAQMRRGAQPLVSEALQGFTPQEIAAAERLIADAGARNVALTFDEALNQVTNGRATRLSQLNRVATNSGGEGGETMGRFYAERPGQVEAAGRQSVDSLAPNPYPADQAAAQGQRAAQGALGDVRAQRSAQTRPHYQAAASDVVPEGNMRRVLAELDNIIAQDATGGELSAAARELRARLIETPAQPATPATRTPVLGPNGQVVRYQTTPGRPAAPETPRTRVGDLDPIYGAARDEFGGPAPLGASGTQARGQQMTARALDSLDTELQAASPALRQGRQTHAQLSETLVNPAENGPLGKIAATDPGAQGATQSMGRALAGVGEGDRYAATVAQNAQRLVRRDPRAAETLVRDYVGDVFNRAIGDLKSGPDQYGGAGFRAALVGDPASARNLEAVVSALPNGAQRWQGFQRFLDVMEATGYKPVKGSDTAFNQAIQKELQSARGPVGMAIEEASKGGLGLKKTIEERWARYRMGGNSGELARLLTDPRMAPLLRQLAQEPTGSGRAQYLALRLTFMAERAANAGKAE